MKKLVKTHLFFNLAPKEKKIVKEKLPFVTIPYGYSLPLDGYSFSFIGIKKRLLRRKIKQTVGWQ